MSGSGDQERIAALERKLAARDKTIAVLIDRQLESRAHGTTGLNLLEQNIALEKVVTRKTQELARERAELESALARLSLTQARLLQARKMEAIGQLATGIAHEINTPTQFVSDNVRFLESSLPPLFQVLDAAQAVVEAARAGGLWPGLVAELDAAAGSADLGFLREELPMALEQSRDGLMRIATIVKAMKVFSHPSGEVMHPEDLASIIRNAAIVAQNEWRGVAELRVEIAPGLPRVPCLSGEIGQLVMNLIVNAAHAIKERMAQGDPLPGLITISASLADDQVLLRFADNGAGIPEEIRDRVFDPFFTTKPVGKGTGQGLAIAYSTVVDQHKGQIFFESEGPGTCFHVRLPLRQDAEA
ncbi:MAG: ATP-binding protein [Holophaga sp.]|nr:ATP-binding protein [Holophaga sp.]